MDYAAELAFEIHLLRGECSEAASGILAQHPVDEAALEECARLEEALARAHRLLQHTLNSIKAVRVRRKKQDR